MKTSKITSRLITLITFLVINSFGVNVPAQKEGDPLPKCTASADQIYYVSGQSVTEVHPGSNGGNGYQLNILGSGADKFQLVQEPYMSSVSVIPGYTNSTQAKWAVFFRPKMGQVISGVRMTAPNCGRARQYQLTESVRLLDR